MRILKKAYARAKESEFWRFFFVGTTILLANTAVLFVLTELLGIPYRIPSIVCFVVAVIAAFIGHSLVTFKERSEEWLIVQLAKYATFRVGSFIAVPLLAPQLVDQYGLRPYQAQFIAIVFPGIISYFVSRWIIKARKAPVVPGQVAA